MRYLNCSLGFPDTLPEQVLFSWLGEMGWTHGLSPHLISSSRKRNDLGLHFGLTSLPVVQSCVSNSQSSGCWSNGEDCCCMNKQPPVSLGSGEELPCGWKNGKLSAFWKEQHGRVVLTGFSECIHPAGMRVHSGTTLAIMNHHIHHLSPHQKKSHDYIRHV